MSKTPQVHVQKGDEQSIELGRIFLLTQSGKPNIINSFHRCRGGWVSVARISFCLMNPLGTSWNPISNRYSGTEVL